MLNLMYLYIFIWKRHATNDIQICQITCIGPDKSTYNAYILLKTVVFPLILLP